MKPLNKEEQKVLDNAPEGAEFYVTLCQLPSGNYARKKVKFGMSAEYIGIDSGFLCSVFDCRISSSIKLADLRARKEQSEKKTVWQAIATFGVEIPELYVSDHVNVANNYYITFVDGAFGVDDVASNNIVCDKYEFNQCVIDLSGPTEALKEWQLHSHFDREQAKCEKPVEWDGKGLPPVGCECHYNVCNPNCVDKVNQGHHGKLMDVVAHDAGLVVLVSKDKSFATACNDQWVRQAETPEQKKLREREEKIKLCEYALDGMEVSEIAELLVDLGVKLPE